jgi:PhnB protein
MSAPVPFWNGVGTVQVPFKPHGYHAVTPYLAQRDCAAAIDLYARAFGAERVLQPDMPGNKIAHAEIRIGDSIVMMSDEMPDRGDQSPATLGGSPIFLMIYVADVDAAFARALASGATQVRPLENPFYGDRTGTLVDPFGYRWTLSTHIEDVSAEQMQRRMAAMA